MTASSAAAEAPLRETPHSIELEQAMLGAVLVNNEAYHHVFDFLKPEHFYEPIHQEIFQIAAQLIGDGKVASPVTLKTFLPDIYPGLGMTIGQYLARLAAEATTVINAADYGRSIYDLAIRRSLIDIGEDMVNAAYKARADEQPGMIAAAAYQALDQIAKPAGGLNECDAGDDVGPIAPRGWLLGNQFCRQFLSSLVAPGSTGKSALRYTQMLSLTTGRMLTGQHVFRRCRVLLLSLEDDLDEMKRRVAAGMIHHQIDRSEVKGWLFYAAPKGLKLAEMQGGSRQIGQLERLLRDAIARRQVDLVILDPFVKLHALEENDNGAMDWVCDLLTKLAIECNIAIDAPHHTKKGSLTAGDADNGRGASGIRDAGRLVYTLSRMSEDEAKQFGVPERERQAYVRLDNAKVNLVLPSSTATWFKLVSVRLDNGTPEYPNGDQVQTIVPWSPPETWDNVSTDSLNAALTGIEVGMPNGQRYSGAPSAKGRAAWLVVQQHCHDRTEAQCREIIKTWVKNGVLYEEEYDDPIYRKVREGLRVNTAKRPGSECAP